MACATKLMTGVTIGALLALHGEWAGAAVTQVEVNPVQASIPSDRGSSVALTWRATSAPDVSGLGGGGSAVTSSGGVFRADDAGGPVIGTAAQVLTGIAQGPAGQAGIAVMVENLVVPAGVLQQAGNLGATRIVYQRGFLDPSPVRGGGTPGSVTLVLQAPLQVAVTPATANAAVGQASTVSVTWQVSGSSQAGAPVSSPRGEFLAHGPGGQLLGVHERSLQSPTHDAGGGFTAMLPETIEVPVQVVLRAQQLNANRIAYRRTFISGTAQPETATLLLNLAGSLGGPFGLSGVALRFGDGARQSVVAPGSTLVAFAEVVHTGTGRLEAEWEIAEPSSTRGTPIFRSLSLIRRQLAGSGSGTLLRSPPLPTGAEGAYLVRLRVTRPDTGFDPPVMRYFVNPAHDAQPEPAPIVTLGPAAGAAHVPGMRFSWQPLAGASVYRVEFHAGDASAADLAGSGVPEFGARAAEPLSGIAVDANVTDTELSRLALSHLPPGRTYWWRVIAYDELGRVVGKGELRRLHVPAPDGGS